MDNAADARKELPPGWARVESQSRPGQFVFENTSTGERQAWFPTAVAAPVQTLPPGWRMVESRSRPGEFVYENISTGERQARYPGDAPLTAAATAKLPSGWKQVESRSHPGMCVFENLYTGERQAWKPTGPAPRISVHSQKPCSSCGKALAALGCELCTKATYCNDECRKTHWRDGGHKQDCQEHVRLAESLAKVLINMPPATI